MIVMLGAACQGPGARDRHFFAGLGGTAVNKSIYCAYRGRHKVFDNPEVGASGMLVAGRITHHKGQTPGEPVNNSLILGTTSWLIWSYVRSGVVNNSRASGAWGNQSMSHKTQKAPKPQAGNEPRMNTDLHG